MGSRGTSRGLSSEEEAKLARSNKKVKAIHHANFTEGNASTEKEFSWGKGHANQQSSFKEKLVGELPGAYRRAFDLMDQSEASPTFVGFNTAGFKASSFIPKSLSPKQAPKSKKVLAKGRAVSNISKISVDSNHHNYASLTPTNHHASLTFMGAEMGNHSEGFCRGSDISSEGSGKDSKEAAMEAVQFSAQRSPEHCPTVIRRDHEFGSVDVHRSCEISEFDSLGMSSKVLIEDGEGEINLLGSSILNPTESNAIQHNPMEDAVGEKGDRGLGLCSIDASVPNGDHCDGPSALPANSNAREGQGKEVMEEDSMEFDGRGDITSAC